MHRRKHWEETTICQRRNPGRAWLVPEEEAFNASGISIERRPVSKHDPMLLLHDKINDTFSPMGEKWRFPVWPCRSTSQMANRLKMIRRTCYPILPTKPPYKQHSASIDDSFYHTKTHVPLYAGTARGTQNGTLIKGLCP